MATYHSTRSRTAQLSAKEAIRRGIAPDGGLYVSDELGQSKIDLEGLANKDYFEPVSYTHLTLPTKLEV